MPNNKSLIIKIADLFIEDDESSLSWKKDPRLLSVWYLLFCSVITFIFINLCIIASPLHIYFEKSPFLTSIDRIFILFYFFYLFVVTIIFTFNYYQHTIKKNRDIYLANILFFYVLGIVCFFSIYYYLYYLCPTLFITDRSFPIPSSTMGEANIPNYMVKLNFILFSAFQGINNDFFRIHSNSLIVSTLTYIQSLYNASLVVLFISGFINQRTK
jgi:hypothetical protein